MAHCEPSKTHSPSVRGMYYHIYMYSEHIHIYIYLPQKDRRAKRRWPSSSSVRDRDRERVYNRIKRLIIFRAYITFSRVHTHIASMRNEDCRWLQRCMREVSSYAVVVYIL